MPVSLKQKTVSGIIWSGIERFSVQGVQFLIQIIMARLLMPEDYGVIGMLAIFLAIAQSFIDSGFSNALIQKHDCSDIDYSTVFWFNIIIGVIFYLLLFFISPWIAIFYNTPILEILTKIIGLILVVNSLTVVQRAQFTIRVDFKTQAKASFTAVIISGLIGIAMAYYSFGIWALVWQTLIYGGINMILLWYLSQWKPMLKFSTKSFRSLFTYGSKLLLAGLLETIYRNIYTIVIGKKFAAIELGYFTRADQFASFPSSNLSGIIGRVTFPILSSIKQENDRLRDVYRKYLRLSAFIIFPLMTGLAALSSPFIKLVLTDKWDGAIILLQILCFSYMWYPVHVINLNLLEVKGRSDLFLRLEVIKKVIGVIILIITIPMGIEVMCWGIFVSSLFSLVINTYYTGRLLQLGFIKQLYDLLPILLYALIMALIVYVVTFLFNSNSCKLLIGIVTGVLSYYGISSLTHSKELQELFSLFKNQ